MDLKELEREKSALEIELRTMRNKKFDLEKALRQLESDIKVTAGKVAQEKSNMSLLSQTHIQLQKDYTQHKALLDAVKRDTQKQHTEIIRKLRELEDARHALNLQQTGIDNWKIELREQEAQFKAKDLQQKRDIAGIAKREQEASILLKTAEDRQKEYKAGMASIAAERESLTAQQAELDKLSDSLDKKESELNKREVELKNGKVLLLAQKDGLMVEKKELTERLSDLAVQSAAIIDRESRVRAEEKKIESGYASLEHAKKEVQVLELRVKKLIHDKDLEKEIKDLENSLPK